MRQITAIFKESNWTRTEAAQRCGVTQPRINDLLRCRVSRFSLDALVNIATAMGRAVQSDPEFACALLDEAVTLFLNGGPETAKMILRDLVNATVGFEALATSVEKSPKSVHSMLSAAGNPTMTNLAAIFSALKRALKVEIQARAVSVA
jgi:DNA-binding phage protein